MKTLHRANSELQNALQLTPAFNPLCHCCTDNNGVQQFYSSSNMKKPKQKKIHQTHKSISFINKISKNRQRANLHNKLFCVIVLPFTKGFSRAKICKSEGNTLGLLHSLQAHQDFPGYLPGAPLASAGQAEQVLSFHWKRTLILKALVAPTLCPSA